MPDIYGQDPDAVISSLRSAVAPTSGGTDIYGQNSDAVIASLRPKALTTAPITQQAAVESPSRGIIGNIADYEANGAAGLLSGVDKIKSVVRKAGSGYAAAIDNLIGSQDATNALIAGQNAMDAGDRAGEQNFRQGLNQLVGTSSNSLGGKAGFVVGENAPAAALLGPATVAGAPGILGSMAIGAVTAPAAGLLQSRDRTGDVVTNALTDAAVGAGAGLIAPLAVAGGFGAANLLARGAVSAAKGVSAVPGAIVRSLEGSVAPESSPIAQASEEASKATPVNNGADAPITVDGKNVTGAAPDIVREKYATALNMANDQGEPLTADKLEKLLSGHPDATPADVNETFQRFADFLHQKPGPAASNFKEFFANRAENAFGRVKSALDSVLGDKSAYATNQALQAQKKAAAPLYDELHNLGGMSSPELDAIAQTPDYQDALPVALRMAKNDRVSPSEIGISTDAAGNMTLAEKPTFKTLDYIKRALDQRIEDLTDPVTGKMSTAGQQTVQIKNDLVNELDRLTTDSATGESLYAKARSVYGGPARQQEVLRNGQNVFNDNYQPEELADYVKGLSPDERNTFNIGVRQALAGKAGSGPNSGGGNIGTRVLGNTNRQQLIRGALGDEAFSKLKPALQRESQFFQQSAKFGNSATALRGEAKQVFDTATGSPITQRLAAVVQPKEAIINAVGNAIDKKFASGWTPEQIDYASKLMLPQNRPQLMQLLRSIEADQSVAANKIGAGNALRSAGRAGTSGASPIATNALINDRR